MPITHGDFVEFNDGRESLDLAHLFTSPNEYAFIGFSISSTLFLSSLLLADYSKASEEMEAYTVYRRDAIMLGPVSVIMAFFIMFTLKREAFWIYENMIDDLPLL